MLPDEIDDPRGDLLAETRAVEHTVMADIRLQIMHAHVVWNVRTDRLRGMCLPDARYVVIFAFDGEQGNVADRLGIAAGVTAPGTFDSAASRKEGKRGCQPRARSLAFETRL